MQEDFHTLTYGFKMSGDETDIAVMSPVKELEEELGRIVKVNGSLCSIVECISMSLVFSFIPRIIKVKAQSGYLV